MNGEVFFLAPRGLHALLALAMFFLAFAFTAGELRPELRGARAGKAEEGRQGGRAPPRAARAIWATAMAGITERSKLALVQGSNSKQTAAWQVGCV